ncbi:hypothetical protein BAU15_00030 [Enterococcus sp. JM4C]|uniref:sugar phosphate isomerase/epimerase family protein n=1 Tax=Candidatus Enterococcus huntleyi TaxID=1857217 RepID=UPI00137A5C64|nr:sugar phosphate isomerase/epimerase [Enterococcus sp. JM4C]KAF1299069.1 hypothetical protein BAU15_00030 [Enterococcus sp. JM4C]
MVDKGIQQLQLRQEFTSESRALSALQAVKEAGYDGIELNGFMMQKMSLGVRALLRASGMPVGKTGSLNWPYLLKESQLKVISIHQYLNGLETEPQKYIEEARNFQTNKIVLTGMRRFDYSDEAEVIKLCERLNKIGATLAQADIQFLYHNHNCEFVKLSNNRTAFDVIIENTDPEFVQFEFDSFWAAETGCDVEALMQKMGTRLKLYHICDRGVPAKEATSSIVKSDSTELGYGNMNLEKYVNLVNNHVDAIVVETLKNWVDNSGLKSMQKSADFMNKFVK